MKRNLLLSFTLFALSLCTQVIAQTYTMTWTGSSPSVTKYWDDPANWSGGDAVNMPYPYNHGGSFFAVVNFSGTATVTFRSGQGPFIRRLNINSGNVTLSTEATALARASLYVESDVPNTTINMSIASSATLTVADNDYGFLLTNNYGTASISGTLDVVGTSVNNSFYGGYQHAATGTSYNTIVNSGGKIKLSGAGSRVNSTGTATCIFASGSTLWMTRLSAPMFACNMQSGSTLQCDNTTTYNSSAIYGCSIYWNVPSQTGVLGDYTWGISTLANVFGGTFYMQAGHLRFTSSGYTGSSFGGINVSGGSLDFRPTAASTTSAGSINISGGYFGVSGVALGSSANMTINVTGGLTQSGGTINLSQAISNGVINVSGDVNQTAGTLTETGTSTLSAIAFKGTSIQNATFSGTLSGDKLIIITNNAGNHVNLLSDAVLPYRLQCTSGNMILGAKNLTVTEKVFGSRTGGRVVTDGTGTLTLKNIDNIGKDFPIGSSNTSHDAVYVTNATGTSDFTVRVGATINPNSGFGTFTPLPRQWEITSASAGANLEFDPAPAAGAQTATKTIGRYTGSAWVTVLGPDGVNQGYPYSADFTAFSSFVVGAAAAIPVELVKFTAKSKDKTNIIEWSTATERNVSHFDIERSANGLNGWLSIATMKPKGTTQGAANYEIADEGPLSMSYYRLTSVDNDGTKETSKIVSVNRSGKSLKINSLSPMPATLDVLTLDLQTNNGEITIRLTDITGKTIQTEKRTVSEGRNTIAYPLSKIANGVYFLSVFDGQTQLVEKIVKQ